MKLSAYCFWFLGGGQGVHIFIPSGEGGRRMADFTVYLIGYGNQMPEDLCDRFPTAFAGEGCLVLDVRARRRSWAWSYSGPQCEFVFKKLGHDYIWLPQLGATRNGDPVHLIDEEFGLLALESLVRKHTDQPVLLLCAERLSDKCHRRLVAEKLAERLARVGDQLEVRPL